MILTVLLARCSTTGNFKVPKLANLYIYKRPVPVVINVDESISTDEVIVSKVTSKPFFWTALDLPPGGGIQYKIEKSGKMIKDKKLCSKYRVISIFWPPFSLIYWPLGYHPDITYDLVNDVQNCH